MGRLPRTPIWLQPLSNVPTLAALERRSSLEIVKTRPAIGSIPKPPYIVTRKCIGFSQTVLDSIWEKAEDLISVQSGGTHDSGIQYKTEQQFNSCQKYAS